MTLHRKVQDQKARIASQGYGAARAVAGISAGEAKLREQLCVPGAGLGRRVLFDAAVVLVYVIHV